MNGGYEEVLLRAVDEVVGAVRAFGLPTLIEAEVRRQLSGDSSAKPSDPPKRDGRKGIGLRVILRACGLSAGARTRLGLDAMIAVDGAVQERIAHLVQSEILRQRPVAERVQREFDQWCAIARANADRRSRLASLQIRGQRLLGKAGVG